MLILAWRERGWRKQSGHRLGVGWLEELVGGTFQPCDSKLAEQSLPSVRLRVAVVEVEGGMEGACRGSSCPAAGSSESGTSVPAALNLGPVYRDGLAGMEGDGGLWRSGNLNSQKRRNSRSVGGRRYYILLIGFV